MQVVDMAELPGGSGPDTSVNGSLPLLQLALDGWPAAWKQVRPMSST